MVHSCTSMIEERNSIVFYYIIEYDDTCRVLRFQFLFRFIQKRGGARQERRQEGMAHLDLIKVGSM